MVLIARTMTFISCSFRMRFATAVRWLLSNWKDPGDPRLFPWPSRARWVRIGRGGRRVRPRHAGRALVRRGRANDDRRRLVAGAGLRGVAPPVRRAARRPGLAPGRVS